MEAWHSARMTLRAEQALPAARRASSNQRGYTARTRALRAHTLPRRGALPTTGVRALTPPALARTWEDVLPPRARRDQWWRVNF